jgi:hypothetical protein
MPFVSGFLRLRRGGHPDQGLPGIEGPVDPGYGVDEGGVGIWPGLPDQGLPKPPPGIWPPPVGIWPPTPLPPDHPMPPGSIWPPVGHPSHPIAPGRPVRPDQGLPRPPGTPDQGLPGQPPHPDQGLPGAPVYPSHGLPTQKFLVAIVALGAGGPHVIGYTVVDPSLRPDQGLPPNVDNTLPPEQGGPPPATPRRG